VRARLLLTPYGSFYFPEIFKSSVGVSTLAIKKAHPELKESPAVEQYFQTGSHAVL
jgi:hypothetical protein